MTTICLLNRHDIENGGTGAPSVIDPGGTWFYTAGPESVTVGSNVYNPGETLSAEGEDPCVIVDKCGQYYFSYTTTW